MSNTINISDIGPIEKLDIQLRPGVNVLRGRNESGKSTALRAVEAVTHGKKDGLEPRDGSPSGYIRGGGVMLSIGKRTRKSGTCEFQVVSDPSDISKLVDPGFVDPAASTRARVRALLSLTGQTITLDEFAEQLGDVDLSGIEEGSDPVETAAVIRKHLQQSARNAEKQANELQGQHDTLVGQVSEFGEYDDADEEALDKQLRERLVASTNLESQKREAERDAENRERLSSLASQYEERLASWNEAKQKGESLHEQEQQAQAAVKSTEERIAELQKQIDEAKLQLKTDKQSHSTIADKIAFARESRQQRESMFNDAKDARIQLEKLPVEMPTEEQFEKAQAAVKETQDAIHRARQTREIRAKAERATEIEQQREAKDNEASRLRNAADMLDDVLSSAVNVAGLSVKHGELVITRGDKTEPLSRLSRGARWKVAIETAAKSVRRVEGDDCLPVVAIPQEAWEGLDTANRAVVQQTGVECGVAIVTAEWLDGELSMAEASCE